MGARLTSPMRTTIGSDAHIIAFAKAVSQDMQANTTPLTPHASGPAAVLVGSVGPVAMAQLAVFARSHPVLTIDLLDERTEEAVMAEALAWASTRIGDQPLGITTAADTEIVERAQKAHGALNAARKAERLLAGVARGLIERGVRAPRGRRWRDVGFGGRGAGRAPRAGDAGIGTRHRLLRRRCAAAPFAVSQTG